MKMGRTRIAMVAVVAALTLTTLAQAALTENYQYKRTAQDDAKAGAIVFQRSDLPPALKSLKGGRIKPDETPRQRPVQWRPAEAVRPGGHR
jgi:hypothetical protein